MKALFILAAVVALAGAALWIAIRINGPAVLDTVDRVSGGDRSAQLVAALSYGSHEDQKLRVYAPRDTAGTLPVFLFMHGGSWRSGDPDDYGFVARSLSQEGFVVVLAGYRLEQDGRYPAMLEDTASAIAAAAERAEAYGGDPARIVISGHSAGAYNVAQVALQERWLAEAGFESGAIRGVVGLAGPYDFYPFDSESTIAAFGVAGAGAESQPVNHARAGAPPMLLVHGEQDTLVKPRNTRALAAALEAAGSEVETLFYPQMDHNAPLISLASPWSRQRDVAQRIAAFARRVTEVSVPVQAGAP